ncbi:MAG: DUF5325 family protein [Caryophanon sp.]|nr:DUF5325 family protein [Caryophanon sp.]
MNKAKLVMLCYAIGAMLSMICIGLFISVVGATGTQYNTVGFIGIFLSIVALCVVFMQGMKQKKKYVAAGLLGDPEPEADK